MAGKLAPQPGHRELKAGVATVLRVHVFEDLRWGGAKGSCSCPAQLSSVLEGVRAAVEFSDGDVYYISGTDDHQDGAE